MKYPKPELKAPALTILVDGSIRQIDPSKIAVREYREALSIGVAELIHQGKLKLIDIE